MDKLTNEELCALIQNGDQQAKETLCIKNKQLVAKYAAAYVGFYGNSLELDDLKQVGYLGLLTAAEKFDVSKGVKFSTYAVHWIRREIMREITEHGFTVRIPLHEMENMMKCSKLNTQYMQEGMEKDERVQMIADVLGMTIDDVKDYLTRRENIQTLSLNAKVTEDDENDRIDNIIDEDAPSGEEAVDRMALKEQIQAVLSSLKPQEQEIIKYRYGFIDGRTYSLAELGKMFGLSEERIRQIEDRALRKMRKLVSE